MVKKQILFRERRMIVCLLCLADSGRRVSVPWRAKAVRLAVRACGAGLRHNGVPFYNHTQSP